MKIVFMGTPDFAVPTLEGLIQSEHQVIGVVTQPDKPKGRGEKMQFTPVKEMALKHNIPVYQPQRVKEEAFIQTLLELKPEAIVVIAFGQILPKAILDMPQYGCINIHASLLPKFRGAAPIQWAVIEGEKNSGITTMFMDVGLDTGDMLLKLEVPLLPDETGGSLHDKLSVLGQDLILETLQGIQDGTIQRIKQDDTASTYVKMLNKQMGKLDFSQSAEQIERLIRGLNPWPSAYTMLDDKNMKVWRAAVIEEETSGGVGEVVEVTKDAIHIQTGKGILSILEIQLEGKKRMTVEAFLRGFKIEKGTIF